MTHINDLDPEVLYRILCLASGGLAKDLDEWKHKLYLLQVCTKWYNLFKSYVFSQGFVGIYPLGYDEYLEVNLKNCVYYSDNVIVCKSNLGIIIGRDKYNCDCVSKLKVIAEIGINISQCFHVVIELLTLGVGYWLNLSFLSFFNNSNLLSKEMGLEEISSAASNYIHDFQNRLPNITHLHVYLNMDAFLRTALYILIGRYAPRLQLLHLNYSFKSPLPEFSTELTSLALDLSNYTHRHPSFYAKPLQYLNFYNISSSKFSWWIFHDFTTPGHMEFTNLKTLDLSYNEQADGEKKLSEKYSKQARPYGSHMLQFPKLVSLILFRPPVDCDVFYTDTTPTHLEELHIRGSCSSIVAASRLRFTCVNKMFIRIFKEERCNDAFYIAADRYFGYTTIGSTCTVDFNLAIDVKQTVSWINITNLELYRIGFDKLLQHIPNFYNLQKLFVHKLYLSDRSLSIIQSGLEEEERGKIEWLDTRIECFELRYVKQDNPYNLLAILNHLLLRTKTLKVINIHNSQVEIVEKSFLSDKFPHVRFR